MKLQRREPELNHSEDVVTCTVTHNIKINGEDAWVKYEIAHRIKENETLEQVDDRLLEHSAQTVVRLAEQAATKVIEFNEGVRGPENAIR